MIPDCVLLVWIIVLFFSPSSAETSSGSLSNAQMTEHYANCIKLSSENVSGILKSVFFDECVIYFLFAENKLKECFRSSLD